jgi:hypothetical protein
MDTSQINGPENSAYIYHFDINEATTARLEFTRKNGEKVIFPFQRFPLPIEELIKYPEVNLGEGLLTVIEAKKWFALGRAFVSSGELVFVADRHYALKKDRKTPDTEFEPEVLQLINGGADLTIYTPLVMPDSDKEGPVDTYRYFRKNPDKYLLFPLLPRTPSYITYIQGLAGHIAPTNLVSKSSNI